MYIIILYFRKAQTYLSVCLSVRNAPQTLNSTTVLSKTQTPNDLKTWLYGNRGWGIWIWYQKWVINLKKLINQLFKNEFPNKGLSKVIEGAELESDVRNELLVNKS